MDDDIDAEEVRQQPTTVQQERPDRGCVVLNEHDTNPVMTEEIVEMAHEAVYTVAVAAAVPKQLMAHNTSPNASVAWEAVGETKSFSDKEIATELKRKLEEKYGGTWHAIVGAHFGGNVTSDAETLVNLRIDKRHFLVFQSGPPDRPKILEGGSEVAGA
ncbi:unnamed protein product [Phytomonas sp. Hart1]|nr:unnamed protein product [Phytomonas sp. Hart1]|eukprot:CCW66951.1 unnamed protein product [Phytomonas sp. isolate Hart1]